MATYLLVWNPKRWQWIDLQECIDDIKQHGHYLDRWSSGNNKKIVEGDRVFIIRLGLEPRGIFASGWATSNVYDDVNWDDAKRAAKPTIGYIDVELTALLNPDQETILSRDNLARGVLARMHWDSQTSGVTIPPDVAVQLEADWARLLASKGTIQEHLLHSRPYLPEELEQGKQYFEGSVKRIMVNAYERNDDARKRCLDYYGSNCCVWGFNFRHRYGETAQYIIHVHHLLPLSNIKGNYELDPIADLRPVCPNCHAVIHSRQPIYTIDEVKDMIHKADSSQG